MRNDEFLAWPLFLNFIFFAFFVHCNRKIATVENMSEPLFKISSTSPPGGNLVDGLPPAASFDNSKWLELKIIHSLYYLNSDPAI